jgi:transposase
LPKGPAVSFHKKAPEHIPEALLPALGPILEQINALTERIRDYDRRLETISKETYPERDLLRQVEGVGTLTMLGDCELRRTPTPRHSFSCIYRAS